MGKRAPASTSECQLFSLPTALQKTVLSKCAPVSHRVISLRPLPSCVPRMTCSSALPHGWPLLGKLGKSHLMVAKGQHNAEVSLPPPSVSKCEILPSSLCATNETILCFSAVSSPDIWEMSVLNPLLFLFFFSRTSLPFWDYRFLGNICLFTFYIIWYLLWYT